MKKIRHQPRVKGGREQQGAAMLASIKSEVTRLARQHNVSKSWVVATVLADAFGIKEQPSFEEPDRRALRRIK